MAPSRDRLRSAFAGQSDVIRAVVASIDDLGSPTRLEGWSIRVLLGHLSTGAEAIWRWAGGDVSGRFEVDEVSYWDPAGQFAEGSSAWALEYASKRSDDEILGGLERALTHGEEVIAEAPDDAVIVPPIGPAWIGFDEFVATRVLELTVHGLDLAAAAGVSIEPDPAAIDVTIGILDRRLEGSRPADLSGEQAWIEAATGRRPHVDDRLPVIR